MHSSIPVASDTAREDERFIKASRRAVIDHVLGMVSRSYCVNPPSVHEFASNKLAQLRAAAACGLRIPDTIVTNDFDHLASFAAKHHGAVIAKPIVPYVWQRGRKAVLAATAEVPDVHTLYRASVHAAHTVFQQKVEKRFELRVTMFGKYVAATKIDSQKDDRTRLDWRASRSYTSNLEPYTLPTSVHERLRAVMQQLGLKFGTFDLAVTSSGDFVFFEVNQAGQFLWQEAYCPECKLAEPFAKYLLEGHDDFGWDPRTSSGELSLAGLKAAATPSEAANFLFAEPYDDAVSYSYLDLELAEEDAGA